eukprot:scaffold237317_cov40-Prasinocladus_malaysianus.AAC.1
MLAKRYSCFVSFSGPAGTLLSSSVQQEQLVYPPVVRLSSATLQGAGNKGIVVTAYQLYGAESSQVTNGVYLIPPSSDWDATYTPTPTPTPTSTPTPAPTFPTLPLPTADAGLPSRLPEQIITEPIVSSE